jgi:hypothetical protein
LLICDEPFFYGSSQMSHFFMAHHAVLKILKGFSVLNLLKLKKQNKKYL